MVWLNTVRWKRFGALRLLAALLLCLIALGARLLFPKAAETAGAFLMGEDKLDRAVQAFYDSVSGQDALPEAIGVFFEALDERD